MSGTDGEPKGLSPEEPKPRHKPLANHSLHAGSKSTRAPATLAIHADDILAREVDVAPAMHVSTTFKYNDDPDELMPVSDDKADSAALEAPTRHVYSRLSTPNTTRLEAVLSSLLDARAITYSSGLSAFHAMLVYLNPRVVAIGAGYHGCHGVLRIMQKLTGVRIVDLHDPSTWEASTTSQGVELPALGKGDIVHVESPLNPTGEAYDIAHYAALAHERGAYLTIDATFAPPPLCDPFRWGADVVMHSGTKYFGGHSDMLCGVLAVRKEEWWSGLFVERLLLGSVMGSFEGWLGLRSLRTLQLRVKRQSANAEAIVAWLDRALKGGQTEGANGENAAHAAVSQYTKSTDADLIRRTVGKIAHASLQAPHSPWLLEQMPNGYGPVFALWMRSATLARRLPSKLALFHHATSLGGVESLIEWRRMSDQSVEETLLRVSVGAEDVSDLIEDLRSGFTELAEEGS